MARVEKLLYATLAGACLLTMVGQGTQEWWFQREQAKSRLGFSPEEQRMFDRQVAAHRVKQAEEDDAIVPIHLDRLPMAIAENQCECAASNLPAATLKQRGTALAIK